MSSPFYQPARQNFSFSQSMQQPQGGFGGFGGYQMPQQSFGGSQGFSGFGGEQGFGFGGLQPQQQSFGGFGGFGGGYGGFQPQQQFNPYQGGFGGGMQQGYNPMFGGIGGLGFNPMMGQGFGMPMQGFNPYQQQQQFNPYQQQQQFQPQQQQFQPQQQPPAPWMPTVTETPGFGDWQQKQKQWVDQTPEGISYTKANEALEAFKKANPNASSYSGYWADPALKAQYDKIYGDYQSGTQTYFNKLNEYEKTNPFSPTAQQPQSPFTGPQRSAQDILSMAVGKTPQDMQYDLNKDGKITSADALAYQRQYGQQASPQTQATAPQAARKENTYVDPSGTLVSSQTGKKYRTASDMVKGDRIDAGETYTISPMMRAMTPVDSGMNRGVYNMSVGSGFGSRQPMFGGIGGLGFNPMMGPQFGMPMGNFGYYR
jgi:biotin carboxyl carrier protein